MTDILIPTPNAKYYNKRIKENNEFYQKNKVANYISNRINKMMKNINKKLVSI